MLGYTLFENNTLGDDSTYVVSNTIHIAQSFTPGTAHNLFTFAFNAINAAACGDATIKICAVDGDGKPTGAALATMVVATADIPTTAADWIYNSLTDPLKCDNTQLIAVVSAAATGLGVRYQSVTMYSAGKAWYSTDSGTTWTEISGGGFLFQDWGQELPLYGTYDVVLYPNGKGTHNELYNPYQAYKPNYACINDPIDAVDHSPSSSIMYALGGFGKPASDMSMFLSGADEGAAGYLTGDTVLWKTGTAGITGNGTNFLSELVDGYLVRSQALCEWYRGNSLPISVVESIEGDEAATLTLMPGDVQGALTTRWDFDKAWYYTPHNTTNADAGKITRYPMCAIPETILPMAYMAGRWTWVTGSAVVTATGGNALSKYLDASWPMQYIASGHTSNKHTDLGEHYPNVGTAYPVLSVDSDNQVTLWDDYGEGSSAGISRVMPDGECKYSYWGFIDDLSSDTTATIWTKPTKKDSYTIKTTLNEGNIHRMVLEFSAYVCGVGTATARPFLLLNGVYSYGTEQTITGLTDTFLTVDEISAAVKQFEVVVSKPGGGVFTKDDLPDLEVGIELGNLSDVRTRMAVYCTQECLIAKVSKLPSYLVTQQRIGIDDVGFIAFDDWDEFNQYVGLDGVNTLGWKVHSSTWYGTWVAKPLKMMRSIGIRLVRPISSVTIFRRR